MRRTLFSAVNRAGKTSRSFPIYNESETNTTQTAAYTNKPTAAKGAFPYPHQPVSVVGYMTAAGTCRKHF